VLAELAGDALDAAGFFPGEHVIDLGCGCGATSLKIAKRVGPEGRVSGYDSSRPMLVVARKRAREAGLENLRFESGDLETAELERGADVAFSFFGLMPLQDPLAAFGRVLRALHSGGRLHFLCWGDADGNPCFESTLSELNRRLDVPTSEPGALGPFGLSDGPRTCQMLEAAGFEEVRTEEWERRIRVPSGRDGFWVLLDLAGNVRSVLDAMDETEREEIVEAVVANLGPYETSAGLELPALLRWVSAWRALEAA
jgi:SAM-dependent methyltransferase